VAGTSISSDPSLLEPFVTKREKDSLQDLRKKLVEVLTKEKLLKTLPKMGGVTRSQLESLLNTLNSGFSWYRYLPLVSR
jgi:hypothetical protein